MGHCLDPFPEGYNKKSRWCPAKIHGGETCLAGMRAAEEVGKDRGTYTVLRGAPSHSWPEMMQKLREMGWVLRRVRVPEKEEDEPLVNRDS